jgi:hypothetical protein
MNGGRDDDEMHLSNLIKRKDEISFLQTTDRGSS